MANARPQVEVRGRQHPAFLRRNGGLEFWRCGEAPDPSKSSAYPPPRPGEKKSSIWVTSIGVSGFDSVLPGMESAAREVADSVVPGGATIMEPSKGLCGN